MSKIKNKNAGFTLLEVIVAVAILALSLTAIFSSQVGAVRIAGRAKHLHLATLLARCKMGEIEEQVAREGLPAINDQGRDQCCEESEIEGYSCEWTIERVVLPDLSTDGEDGANPASSAFAGAASVTDLASSGFDPTMLKDLSMGLAFPALKPSVEEQVRRATVVVHWQEGQRNGQFDIVRFLVSNQPTIPATDTQQPNQ